MRINPSEKIIRAKEIEEERQAKTDKITRIVAIIVAFLSTYTLLIKILFL